MHFSGKVSVVSVLFFLLSQTHAAIDVNALVKVSASNSAKCIEYYRYQNALYCSTTVQDTKPKDPHLKEYETLSIAFDQRPWKMAWGKKTDVVTTLEYIPADDDINQWQELVTSQFFPGLQNKITPTEFARFMIQQLKEAGYSADTKIIKDTADQAILEFSIKTPANQQQNELQMITRDKNGLYVLHYVVKKVDMGKDERMKWLKILENAQVISNGVVE